MPFSFSAIPKFCINLPHRIERRQSAFDEFKKIGVDDVNFIQAVDGSKLTVPELSVKKHEFNAKQILGCMQSHLGIIKQAKNGFTMATHIAIFEDDVMFCDDFAKRMAYIEAHWPEDAGVFFLGGHCTEEQRSNYQRLAGCNHIQLVNEMAGTHAYILKNTTFDFIIRNLSYNWGIDQFYGDVLLKHFQGYAFMPMLAGTLAGFSDIAMNNTDYNKFYGAFRKERMEL